MKKENTNKCAEALPYDMGNIGDLLKHGMMAEFVRWWSNAHSDRSEFIFLDPFCGLRWEYPANPKDLARLTELRRLSDRHFAIYDAQPNLGESKYYGSAHAVINQIRHLPRPMPLSPLVSVSDKHKNKIAALMESDNRIRPLVCEGFDSENGYSVLDSIIGERIRGDLVLIDPFYDIGGIKHNISKIAKAAEKTSVLLFALLGENDGEKWEKIQEALPESHIAKHFPRLEESCGIAGETNYDSGVLLLPAFATHNTTTLRANIDRYTESLSNIVYKPISCE